MGRGSDFPFTPDTATTYLADDPLLAELTTRSCSKTEIEDLVQRFIEEGLEFTDSGSLFLLLKQLKYAAEHGIEQLKEHAFNALGEQLGGLQSGDVMGHEVLISYPREWHYSPAVDDLKEQQRQTLVALQDREKEEGVAKQMPGRGRITITLRT